MKVRVQLISLLFLVMSIFIGGCGSDGSTTPKSSSSALPAVSIGCGSDGTESCMN